MHGVVVRKLNIRDGAELSKALVVRERLELAASLSGNPGGEGRQDGDGGDGVHFLLAMMQVG